jgi:hypothetical protein
LAGLILIRDRPGRLWRASRREIRRVGWVKFLDVMAFRAYARLRLSVRDAAWTKEAVADLRKRYPAALDAVPFVVVSTPNGADARAFLEQLQPDLAIARCKMILKKEIFEIPRVGTLLGARQPGSQSRRHDPAEGRCRHRYGSGLSARHLRDR